ncbi:MAG: hypothetical protein VYD17_07010 [Pseudomonadota bacterium]|nr:hypothetical protein [Pseudomonadota bacterium]
MKAQFSGIAVLAKHRVGITINYLLYRVIQRLRWDSCPINATTNTFT